MFYSCDLLFIYFIFFRAPIFEAEECRHVGPCQHVGMWSNFITQIRGGPIYIPYVLRRENLQILSSLLNNSDLLRPKALNYKRKSCKITQLVD